MRSARSCVAAAVHSAMFIAPDDFETWA